MLCRQSHSSLSLGPQSPTSSSSRTLSSGPETPSPADVLPKYESAFEYAIRPYLALHIDLEQTFKRQQIQTPLCSSRDGLSSLSFPAPRRRRESVVSYIGSDEAESPTLDPGIDAGAKYQHTPAIRLANLYLSTLLTRCTITQTWIHAIYKNPYLTTRQYQRERQTGRGRGSAEKKGVLCYYT